MKSDKLGVAVIGHPQGAPVGEKDPHGRYVAGCDVNEKQCAAAREKFGIPIFSDYREMLALPEVDVVFIRTPNHLHFAPTMAALKAGKHVFCEKPLALSMDQCRKMAALARKEKRLLQVDLELRSSVLTRRVKEIVDSGELGKVRRILFHHYQGAWDHPAGHWRMNLETSGGIFPEKLVHEVDFFRWIAGEIVAVQSFATENVIPQSPWPDCLQSMFWFRSGALGSMLHTQARSAINVPDGEFATHGHHLSFDIIGTKGSLQADAWASTIEVYHLGAGAEAGNLVANFARREDYHALGMARCSHDTGAHFAEFLRRIRAGERELQPPEDVLKTMQATFLAEKSVRSGRRETAAGD